MTRIMNIKKERQAATYPSGTNEKSLDLKKTMFIISETFLTVKKGM